MEILFTPINYHRNFDYTFQITLAPMHAQADEAANRWSTSRGK